MHRGGYARQFGDLLIAAVLLINTLPVGLAFARYGARLLPYLPHLPLEWLALALCLACWLQLRTGQIGRKAIVGYAIAVLATTAAAAACETLLSPHLPARPPARAYVWAAQRSSEPIRLVSPIAARVVGFLAPESCTGGGRVASRSLTLPSPRPRARFRSAARPVLLRACQPPPIPTTRRDQQ